MQIYFVSFDKEGRIYTVNALDSTMLASHPDHKQGLQRILLLNAKGEPDTNLYRQIELHAGQRHYVENGKTIKPKQLVKIALDKTMLKPDGADVATISWTAPDPIQMFCNGRLKGKFMNSLKITSKKAGLYYRIEVDDPKYYSEVPLWLRTQEMEQSTLPSSTSP